MIAWLEFFDMSGVAQALDRSILGGIMPTRIDRSVTLEDLKKLNSIEIDCGRLGIISEERHDVVSQCDLCKVTGCLWFLAGDTTSGFCDHCMLKLINML